MEPSSKIALILNGITINLYGVPNQNISFIVLNILSEYINLLHYQQITYFIFILFDFLKNDPTKENRSEDSLLAWAT